MQLVGTRILYIIKEKIDTLYTAEYATLPLVNCFVPFGCFCLFFFFEVYFIVLPLTEWYVF